MELNISNKRLRIGSISQQHIHEFVYSLIRVGILNKSQSCDFFSLMRTSDGYTLVIDAEGFKGLPVSDHLTLADDWWVPLNVVAGAYTADRGVGIGNIAKSLIIPLADYLISIYCLSSYQADYILVREVDLPKVSDCLSSQDEVLPHSQGKTMPLDRITISPQPLTPSQLRPITHQLTSASGAFHISTVDPLVFPSIGLYLIDALFYHSSESSCCKDDFFSYTMVDGDITLVMDESTLARFPADTVYANEERWRMVTISNSLPQGLGFSECGIVAQISDPITEANISEYYISSFFSDHTLVPEGSLEKVSQLLISRQIMTSNRSTAPMLLQNGPPCM